MSSITKLLLFVLGLGLGWLAVAAVARRLPPGRLFPRLAPDPPRSSLTSAPELRLLAPPTADPAEGEREAPPGQLKPRTSASDVIIRDRTKSSEIVELIGLPGWEAELRDKGHRRGFVIRIRRAGEPEPVEAIQADGMLRAGAREIAIAALCERRED